MSIGIPIKLLHEAEQHIVTIELKTGDQYMGYLEESEVISQLPGAPTGIPPLSSSSVAQHRSQFGLLSE